MVNRLYEKIIKQIIIFRLIMVFYGKKKSNEDTQVQQYRSIRQQVFEQLIKQLGQRATPTDEKSLGTMFSNLGQKIVTVNKFILKQPNLQKNSELYEAYQADKQVLKQNMKELNLSYQKFVKRITQNKFYLISKYPCQSRVLFLNGAVILTSLLAMKFNKTFASKIRSLMATCIFGYGFGGLFVAPQIFNSLAASQKIAL